MSAATDIWAVVPIKELDGAKQRLAPCSRLNNAAR